MIINRAFFMPNKNTFLIQPIQDLIFKYISKNDIWVDPFCNDSFFKSYCKYTNDLNKNYKCTHNLEAKEFLKLFDKNSIDGILFDPPYSKRQIKEHYNNVGLNPTQLDTSYYFYNRCYQEIMNVLKPNGIVISFGWNSNGLGKVNGFKKIEILLVAHGMGHNDTIVTVEKKIQDTLF